MKNNCEIFIWTDGACAGNPGPGGWGVFMKHNNFSKKLKGGELNTTNNRMELMAVIKALESIKLKSKIQIYTDSQYVKNGMTTWLLKWKNNNWKTSSKKDVKNKDLWKKLENLASNYEISWNWVKGHSGNKENEIADSLARSAIPNQRTFIH